MSIPSVTVVIPARNAAGYICQALESVYAQDVPVQVIVIDDGSEDQTVRCLEPYRDREDFTLIMNRSPQGPARCRNMGTELARSEYIAFLDADDWWEKGKLKAQLEILAKSGCVLCTTGRELMEPDGTPTGRYIPVSDRISYRNLLRHNSINCSSVVVRRDAMLEFPMEHDGDSHEDYITWLKMLKKYGTAVGIDRPFLKYRLSKGGKSRNKLRSALMTYRAYRYAGIPAVRSAGCFVSYTLHGLWKYGLH